MPKRLRLFFLYDRRLLGDLSRCAWQTVRELYRAGLEDRHAAAGMVVSIQTFVDQAANGQPHLPRWSRQVSLMGTARSRRWPCRRPGWPRSCSGGV